MINSVCLDRVEEIWRPETNDRKLNVLLAAVKIYDVEIVQRAECYGLLPDACIILLVGLSKFPFRELIFN